jgi:oligogalacturonide lyase
MPVAGPAAVISRRALLALAAGASCRAQSGVTREELPSEAKRYVDAATEFQIIRLTEPAYDSYLTAPYNRGISSHNFLVFSSTRGGKLDAYRVDFKGGPWHRLTDAGRLDPASLALVHDDRGICFIDGGSLRVVDFSRGREHEAYAVEPPYEQLAAIALTRVPGQAYVVERRSGGSRIRLVSLLRKQVADVFESADEIGMPAPRPGGGIAYRRGSLVAFCDQENNERSLPLAPGKNGPFFWAPDGGSLVYLNIPGKPGELNAIREYILASGQERLIAKTTQFVDFAPNANGSVFVGASGSAASPHVLILLRATRRELTLCEHRARDPRNLAVAFAPNSQRVVFESDQHGRPAIYTMPVERFVEETETS